MAAHFGPHPLGRSVLGTAKSVGDLKREQMLEYFERRYSPRNIVLAAAGNVDFAQLIKIYKNAPRTEGRYSPGEIVESEKKSICGNPDAALICTSHVERSNLTLRMTCRRWTRLTNAFSKSWKHHEAAMALYGGHKVEEISKKSAGAANLAFTSNTIDEIIAVGVAREQCAGPWIDLGHDIRQRRRTLHAEHELEESGD